MFAEVRVLLNDWLGRTILPLLVRKVNTCSLLFAPSFLSSHLVRWSLGSDKTAEQMRLPVPELPLRQFA